jgi:hypothetical protein
MKGEPTQIDKFKQAARELECDDNEEAFRSKLKKLTEAPPPESVEKRKKPLVPKFSDDTLLLHQPTGAPEESLASKKRRTEKK